VNDMILTKDVSKAFMYMGTIARNIGIHNVYIVDAALSPLDFQSICHMPGNPGLKWIANARFDATMLKEGLLEKMAERGCTMLRFGLESGAQRVLDLMNKGTQVEIASTILRQATRCGIKNHVYVMFGYPGEGSEERKQTVDFLRTHREVIASYSVSIFQPIPGTPVYVELEEKLGSGNYLYERMLEHIYDSEETYNALMKDVERVHAVLEGYARTNGEYYSANVFSCQKEQEAEIIVQSRMVADNPPAF